MHLWHCRNDPTTLGHLHTTAPGFGHAILAPVLAAWFRSLGVSVAIWEHGLEWMPLHLEPNPIRFEVEHGMDKERNAHNNRQLMRVLEERKPLRSEHAGYLNLYVPVVAAQKVVAVLVAGPVALARPTSNEVLERWRGLTGRQGHLADPEFSAYLASTLSVLVLDARRVVAFERLLVCVAGLMAGEGDADRIANRAEALRAELDRARFAESAWDAVRQVVDERAQRSSYGEGLANALRGLGLSRRADHVLVGLTVSRKSESDAVEAALQRNAFQRSASELARDLGDALTGQVGDYGVVFLSGAKGSAARRRQKVLSLAERVATLGRQRFELDLHFGASSIPASTAIHPSYLAALGAAESALLQGTKLVTADPSAALAPDQVRRLRRELGTALGERKDLLGSRFERYLEAVAVKCGYRLEAARVHLEVGFDQLTEGLVKSGALEEKSLAAMCAALDRAALSARSVSELFAAYRSGVEDVAAALHRPVPARQDRSLRGALDYIHRHYGGPLSRDQVAHVAGFAPSHFSKLFKERERVSFEEYVHGLRLERAKQLLGDTELLAGRVAEQCGFKYAPYFSRVFRQATGMSPLEYREKTHRKPSRRRAAPDD